MYQTPDEQYQAMQDAVSLLLDGLREHGSPELDTDRFITIRSYEDGEVTAEVVER
jgi:hypothetical protein